MKISEFLFVLLLHRSCSVLDIVAPKTHNALIGSTTFIPCSFTVDNLPINPQFLAVLWQYGEREIVRYDNKQTTATARMSINVRMVRYGNASLTIHNVTIADQGTYKCLVIYSPNTAVKDIQLNIQAVPDVTLLKKPLYKNRSNRLLCLITNVYPKDLAVIWLRNGQAMDGSELGPFKIDADGTYRVNSSLVISPTQIQDNPTITCQVDHVSLPNYIQDAFTVQYGVEPQITLFSLSDGYKEIFVCEVKQFYPDNVNITWLLNGKRMESSSRNADGTYNKWDHVLIPGNSKSGKNISCMVEHDMLDSPMMKTLAVTDGNNSEKAAVAAAIAVLATLLIGGILSILYLIKKKYLSQFQLSHIHIPGSWDKNTEEVTMYCMASNCPKEVQVTWIVAEANREKVMVKDDQIWINEEHDQLLRSIYTVKMDQSAIDGLYNVITSLTFIPTPSKHRNINVTCSFQSGSKTKERHKDWSIIRKPCLSAPVKFSLDNSGNIVCSVTLEKFHPKDIQMNWSCGVESYQELDHAKQFINSADGTFKCGSECRVSSHLFQDPEFRVRVIWTHMSMDKPDRREVSARDLPWCPAMGEIKFPTLVHGTEAKIQCEIRGFYPKNLEVRWLRRLEGKPELYEVSPNDHYKIPITEMTQEPDETYTCTTTLIVSVSAIIDEGAEFICQVMHPTLETPLEKRTGELNVIGKPIVRAIFQEGKNIVLKIDSFSTPDIKVTWEKADNQSGPYGTIEEKHIQNNLIRSTDGRFSLTSTHEAAGTLDILISTKKYFKALITHGALKTPEEIFLHSKGGDIYVIKENEKKALMKVNRTKDTESQNTENPEKTTKPNGLEDNQDAAVV